MLENAILRLVFANTVFHKRAMLHIFYTEYTQSVSGILLHQESTMGPSWLGQEKNFQNVGFEKLGKHYVMIGVQVL